MKYIAYAKSINGELVFDNKKAVKSYLESVEGKSLAVYIEKEFGVRSNNQNSWLWGVVYKTIANETGHTEQELHDLFKRMFLPAEFKTVLGVELKIPNSTSKLNKTDFGEYVEKIRAHVAQFGVIIPEPI